MQISILDCWSRIEGWLAANVPSGIEFLAPGATPDQIENAEKVLGIRFPNDVRQSYLLYNGAPQFNALQILGYGEFLCLERMVEEWNVWKGISDSDEEFREYQSKPDAGIAKVWWNRGWIPFCADGGGDSLCIDLAPIQEGNYGQIIELIHDGAYRPLLAPSFTLYIVQLCRCAGCRAVWFRLKPWYGTH